jgi:hypothetical protein
MKKRKLGYYHYSPTSNRRLIELFEKNQKQRYSASNKDWENKEFTQRLWKEEIAARKEVAGMLKRGEIRTADDFYRAGHFFHHSLMFRDYALGLACFSASWHLGDLWGKNYYAVALDRFLVSIKQPQYFTTQFEKRKGKWILSPYRKGVSDKERKEYDAGSFKQTKEMLQRMNQGEELVVMSIK